jgi:hypothetical protein
MTKKKKIVQQLAEYTLKRHFAKTQLHELVTASRTFPVTARVDLQLALEKLFASRADVSLFGVHRQYATITSNWPGFYNQP